MKVLLINDCDYFLYPDSISTLEEFVTYANTHMGRLVPIKRLKEENCVYPNFLEDEIQQYYINPSRIDSVTEAEVNIYSESEYMDKLENVVANVCANCCNYDEDLACPCEDYRDKLTLDGECWDFEDFDEDEYDED